MSYSAGGERLEGGAAGVDTEGHPLAAQLLRDELVQALLHLHTVMYRLGYWHHHDRSNGAAFDDPFGLLAILAPQN
jgi:hypothetical protein